VLGLQTISQLRTIYGPEGAVTLTASPSTKLIMRVDETETANAASELIGRHEIERLTMTQLAGLSTYREGVNLAPHRTIETLVMADEIKLLKPFTGYLCVAGFDRSMIQIPQLHLVRNQPAFVPRMAPHVATQATQVEPTDEEIAAQLMARQ
jgi:type IV secretory pathway TraG/TraD family ATPase VirD4